MQCREFRDVSESYLSDELLVETNHQINHHLEHCPECRTDFAARRELRKLVLLAGRDAIEYKIDPTFSARLEAQLRDEALRKGLWQILWASPKLLISAAAVLVLTLGFGIYFISSIRTDSIVGSNSFTRGLAEIAHLATGNHRHCALEKLGIWEAMSRSDYPEREVYAERIMAPLKARYSDNIELLSVHDCEYQRKQFTHVVLRTGQNIVSVFFDRTDTSPAPENTLSEPIMSDGDNGLQVASFSNKAGAVFVVSDLSEMENLKIARTLSHSLSINL